MTAAVSASAGRSDQHSQPVSVISEDAGQANGRELPGNRELVPVPWPAGLSVINIIAQFSGPGARAGAGLRHDGYGYPRRLPCTGS